MRQFNEDTLTAAVVERFQKAKDPRFREIITSAVKHLHAFAREVHLTEEEWFEGIKFLTAVGQKCDDKRQEFILLSDILGLSMMIVALNHKTVPGATEATVLGPFFAHGAKEYEYGADLREGATMKGEDVYVSGRVGGFGCAADRARWHQASGCCRVSMTHGVRSRASPGCVPNIPTTADRRRSEQTPACWIPPS